jgi:DNA-binding PadR family transcriptional regulator
MEDKLIKRLQQLNTKDCLWIYILSILSEKPTHAYSIRSEIEKKFNFLPGNVTAYRVLYYLTSQNFVKKMVEGRRKVYYITAKGEMELSKAITFYKKQLKLINAH